ncbi:hypothetical protein [Phaeobacter inhibens]|uniref:hypothetical protein n=1 Tax=Phaeobacter inhibens TaxID=221822 RepID=UPI0021A4C33B|nr:hypothetical protein [Phaeobacter inhibens]UWS08263.1 hypothetical protein K4K98_00840 [Phaeobacter inhibens]
MANLDVKIEQTRQRLRDLQTQARQLKRKDDTRRKVLYGIASLALLEDLPEEKRQNTLARLHAKLTKKADRDFLGLPSLPEDTGNQEEELDQTM